MAAKKTGISPDLVIHPGETIAEILENRGITQHDLALRTGVSSAYVSCVINGEKGISANFARGLEYALGVPKSFWLNLQTNYETELLDINETATITDKERKIRNTLSEAVSYLRKEGMIPARESKDASILSLRKALQISNLENLENVIPEGPFRISSGTSTDPYILGAWIQLCQISGSELHASTKFNIKDVPELIQKLKRIMCEGEHCTDLQEEIAAIMGQFGIIFTVMQYFRKAPVQGYIFKRKNEEYQMVLTLRGAYADIFWFSLFHEIGHIVNGDLVKTTKFLDVNVNSEREEAANLFARNELLSPDSYDAFTANKDFSIEAIKEYAARQNVMPYIVIGRLQKEGRLRYDAYSSYKIRYK